MILDVTGVGPANDVSGLGAHVGVQGGRDGCHDGGVVVRQVDDELQGQAA